VGFAEEDEDDEPFEEKMERLTTQLAEQFRESWELEERIKENLKGIGYDI
jgi:type I restriction enzyme M protein